MKMQNFYCFIGPKASVTGALGGLKVTNNLSKIDSVPTDNNKPPKLDEVQYLKDINLKNVHLEGGDSQNFNF